jgi:hypothetical protein
MYFLRVILIYPSGHSNLMLKTQFKTQISALIMLFCFILLEALLVSVYAESLPNKLSITIIENFGFYINLLSVNQEMAARFMLIDNPVFIVQRLDEQKIVQFWGLYIMPVNIVILYSISLFIVGLKNKGLSAYSWGGIWGASFVLMCSIFYMRIQTCCTSDPTWIFEIWLFSQISNPFLDSGFWQEMYIQLSGWFAVIQFSLVFISIGVLFLIYYMNVVSKKNSSEIN